MPYIETPPIFTDLIGATDLNILRDDLAQLDGLSYRTLPAFPSSDFGDRKYAKGDLRIWWGSLRWQTGLTTLTWQGSITLQASEHLSFRVNGVEVATRSAAGAYTITTDISSGYADGDILDLEIRTVGRSGANYNGNYPITAIYATPVVAPTWPGTPTFATGYWTDTQLNQLGAAISWLKNRIYSVPILPWLSQVYRQATHKIEVAQLFSGTLYRLFAGDIWRIGATVTTSNDVLAEQLRVWINETGPILYPSSGSMLTEQTYQPYLAIDASAYAAVGSGAYVRIEANVTDAWDDPENDNSVYTVYRCGNERPAGGYPVAALPPRFEQLASLSPATLTSYLNQMSGVAAAIKTRIDATPVLWGRVWAIRRRFAKDDHENTKLGLTYLHQFDRFGRSLIVRGKGVGIGWGAKVPDPDPDKRWVYTFEHTQTITKSDQVETQIFYLDTASGLLPSMRYYLIGDVHYCAEYL